jgi:ATP-binding cassette subfamily C (CFTR/MRP) protein 1
MRSHFVWDSSLQVVAYLCLLYYYIGWATFAGIGVIVVLVPFVVAIVAIVLRCQKEIANATDARINATNEVLLGMLGVKMAAWEEKIAKMVGALRLKEIGYLRTMEYVSAAADALTDSAPAFIATR